MMLRFRWFTIVAAGLLATPAVSLTPAMPQCTRAELNAEEVRYEGYAYTIAANDFVFYERRLLDGGRWEFIYEHCPSLTRLTIVVTGNDEADNRQRLHDAMVPLLEASESEKTYTLRDLRRLAQQEGAKADISTTDAPSCVCSQLGY